MNIKKIIACSTVVLFVSLILWAFISVIIPKSSHIALKDWIGGAIGALIFFAVLWLLRWSIEYLIEGESNRESKKPRKIVINVSPGGHFALSHEALMKYAEKSDFKLYAYTEDHSKTKLSERMIAYNGGESTDTVHYYRHPVEDVPVVNNEYFCFEDMKRDDPNLVAVVEEMGSASNGEHSRLKIVTIPWRTEWEIDNHDGLEHSGGMSKMVIKKKKYLGYYEICPGVALEAVFIEYWWRNIFLARKMIYRDVNKCGACWFSSYEGVIIQ